MKFTMPIIYVVQGSYHEMISFQTEQSITRYARSAGLLIVSLRSYGTPTYCDVPPIKINNKTKYHFI